MESLAAYVAIIHSQGCDMDGQVDLDADFP